MVSSVPGSGRGKQDNPQAQELDFVLKQGLVHLKRALALLSLQGRPSTSDPSVSTPPGSWRHRRVPQYLKDAVFGTIKPDLHRAALGKRSIH